MFCLVANLNVFPHRSSFGVFVSLVTPVDFMLSTVAWARVQLPATPRPTWESSELSLWCRRYNRNPVLWVTRFPFPLFFYTMSNIQYPISNFALIWWSENVREWQRTMTSTNPNSQNSHLQSNWKNVLLFWSLWCRSDGGAINPDTRKDFPRFFRLCDLWPHS